VALDRLEGGGRAALRIRDDGVGIPPEIVPMLFQPFMQAERSLARTRGGLGLGLALVRALVELHGGTVRASSDGEGKGAEFTVELPLEPPGEARVEEPPAAPPAARSGVER
jgi:signal transduction histidine kinase